MFDEPSSEDASAPVLPDDQSLAAPIDVACDSPEEFVATATTVGDDDPVELPQAVGTPALPDLAATLQHIAEAISRRLDDLTARLDRDTRAEETREKVVDRLHAELQEYKNDLLLRVMKPMFLDLIHLHDDLGKRTAAVEDERLAAFVADYQQAIEDILYRQGVEPFQAEDGPFDPKRQRAVSTVLTEDPEQNKKIAARVRKGFAAAEKVIRPEMVTVYSLRK